MVAYSVDYKLKNDDTWRNISTDARDLKSAKKDRKKHGYKDGRMITIYRSYIIGYY